MKYQAVTQAVLNIGCDFQNLQPYHFEPEKQKQLSMRSRS